MKKKIVWDSHNDFIQKYIELKSARKMGEIYGCDKSTIINHCNDIGFDYKNINHSQLTDEDKKKIISEYNTKTSSELAKEYNVSRGIITKLWYNNNLKHKTRDTANYGNNLIGMTFGYLTVIDCSEKRAANGGRYWICSCNCGRDNCLHIKEIYGHSLTSGKVISCGTISKEKLENGRKRERT